MAGKYVTNLNFPALFKYSKFQLFDICRAQAAAISKGFNDDMDTYILIAGIAKIFEFLLWFFYFFICVTWVNFINFTNLLIGMWSCTFYLGNFLGPTLAGLAVEKYGFRATTIGFFALDSGIILVDLFELYFSFKRSKEKDYEQLE